MNSQALIENLKIRRDAFIAKAQDATRNPQPNPQVKAQKAIEAGLAIATANAIDALIGSIQEASQK